MQQNDVTEEDQDPLDGASPNLPAQLESPSIWSKAKKTLIDVSAQASSTGGALAGKAVAVTTTGMTKTTEATRGAITTSKQVYAGSKLESVVKTVDNELEQRGAKKALKDTTGAVVGKLDQVTGKKLVEMLEERLRVQDEYNDILATRLAEALERIAKLEARIDHED